MNSTSTSVTGAAAHNAAPSVARPAHFAWKVYAFEVSRRPGKVNIGRPVKPRRISVHAPYPEAAAAGAGAGRDEICRPVPLHPLEPLVARRRPQRQEIADFFETVGSALTTGGGMALALGMAARGARSPMMRGTIGALYDMIVHGEEMHVAMRRFPRVFTPMQIAMVEAAAKTGLESAGALLITLSARLHKEGKVLQKFVEALAYPASLMLLTIVGAIVLEVWALPPMVELFRTLGGRLPPLTQLFYTIAQSIHGHAITIASATTIGLVLLFLCLPRILKAPFVQRTAIRLWAIGPVVQWMALVRALGTFVLLKQSGARVRDQFAMASAASGNCVVGEFFDACYARIALGESIEEAFTAERHRLGDDGVRLAGKMEVGMAGADLPTLINRMVDEFDASAETRLNLMPNMIRWPLLIFCCLVIGLVALAIVLPYPNLIADVAQQQTNVR